MRSGTSRKRPARKETALRAAAFAVLAGTALSGCAGSANPMAIFETGTPAQDQVQSGSVERARPVRVPDVAALPSKSPAYLVAHFGEPDVKRSEEGAQFWTYSHDNCVLYFILYDEGKGDYSLHHMEVDRQIADQSTLEGQLQACVKDIAVAHQAPGGEVGSCPGSVVRVLRAEGDQIIAF